VLQLAKDQSRYVASILSRRARFLGLMWDLYKTALLGRMSHSSTDRAFCPVQVGLAGWLGLAAGRRQAEGRLNRS